MTLSPDDFSTFFHEVYGYEPFPWQKRLLDQVVETGTWPSVLDLPTGAGKTAAVDVAVFHLALEAHRGELRRASVRIALVVDRRLVVDDAFARAQQLACALAEARGTVTASVAESLNALSEDGKPLRAYRLRGGVPREDTWARTPSQPTVLCSTVDQIGSRLLFRGYGVSDSMKPVHAGLIGSDCLILLDEAHLAEPFRQTLRWVNRYRRPEWCEQPAPSPWGVALLTATPGDRPPDTFLLGEEDHQHPILKRRLDAAKPARLVLHRDTGQPSTPESATGHHERPEDLAASDRRRAVAIAEQVQIALSHFAHEEAGAPNPAIGVVVNRVARARAVFEQLTEQFSAQITAGQYDEPTLMIGPARPVDRAQLAASLEPIRTRGGQEGEHRSLSRPLILVATQCVEAGVDIDLDALITEAAPLDCLRQRFGRLNRAGRPVRPYAAVVAMQSDLAARNDDPIYGKAIASAWKRLIEASSGSARNRTVDFGLRAFAVPMSEDAITAKADAPVLMPAHLDLLSQTFPPPASDPDVALYLHGAARQPDSVSIIWRGDVSPQSATDENMRRLLSLVPPRAAEAIQLPLWTVRRWLSRRNRSLHALADVVGTVPDDDESDHGGERPAFRWRGDNDASCWISPTALRPGDTIVVPASYGGVDRFGWHPDHTEPATDVARAAAEPFAGRRFAVRVAPGLLEYLTSDETLADVLAGAPSLRWQDLRTELTTRKLPETVLSDLAALDAANKRNSVTAHIDVYGLNDGRPRGVIFSAPFGIRGQKLDEEGRPNSTEDDVSGSLPGFALSLRQHSRDVEQRAEAFARAAGLPAARVADVSLAGFLHDSGKADARFQAWLHYGDPLGADPEDETTVLAKSGRSLPPAARSRSGLPAHWRHEVLSVRGAIQGERVLNAQDPGLVLWLIGSHHGQGRPFFKHVDPTDRAPHTGPHSLAFNWRGLDWPSLFERLKARYGLWELARMEAILRLADHRASEARATEGST